jgi:two-component response regulator (ARR-B family)
MWFLNNKVVLTKNKLAMQNWHGYTKCYFCDSDETVEHLFISYPFAHIVWHMVYFTYNIPSPINITNMFSNWLNEVGKTDKERIRIGVSALCWSIWTYQNNFMFNKHVGTNFLQIIGMVAHWIQLWSMLLPEDQRNPMVTGCNRLLTVTHDFYKSRLLAGDILVDFRMDSHLFLLLFCWLIHVSILADP